MSGFLDHLARRAIGPPSELRPRTAGRFEDQAAVEPVISAVVRSSPLLSVPPPHPRPPQFNQDAEILPAASSPVGVQVRAQSAPVAAPASAQTAPQRDAIVVGPTASSAARPSREPASSVIQEFRHDVEQALPAPSSTGAAQAHFQTAPAAAAAQSQTAAKRDAIAVGLPVPPAATRAREPVAVVSPVLKSARAHVDEIDAPARSSVLAAPTAAPAPSSLRRSDAKALRIAARVRSGDRPSVTSTASAVSTQRVPGPAAIPLPQPLELAMQRAQPVPEAFPRSVSHGLARQSSRPQQTSTATPVPVEHAGGRPAMAAAVAPLPRPSMFRDSDVSARNQAADAGPTVQVTIGRVEIRAVVAQPATAAPARRAAPSKPALSLSDYLQRREGGRS